MDVIALARQVGHALQKDERYLALMAAQAATDNNQEIQESIRQFNALRAQINAELLKRGNENDVIVPPGVYVVGVDIPAGDYTISPQPIEYNYTYISAYADDRHYMEYSTFHFFNAGLFANKNDYIGKLSLAEGNIVKIEDGAAVFSPYQGLGF